MSETIIVAILSLVGTLFGSIGGILASQKLTEHRIKELEKKVDKHNQIVERTYKLEGEVTELQHDVRDIKTRMNRGESA